MAFRVRSASLQTDRVRLSALTEHQLKWGSPILHLHELRFAHPGRVVRAILRGVDYFQEI